MLNGSVAMSIYVLPRATRDFDFVVNLQKKDIILLMSHFKEGYYCDEDAVKEAIENQSMFKIIDHASGYKADFVILKNEPFRITELNRRIEADFLEHLYMLFHLKTFYYQSLSGSSNCKA